MSDIKLFRVEGDQATELEASGVQIERTLQRLFERHLETLLGIRFLASEYSTGAAHGGRIDTLGIDEDGSPVIIEYKRAVGENVINQGLFYLDWLLDHRREFQWLVMDVLGKDAADRVEWASPRLLCVASDFTRYDGHAVKQIQRNIELLRYRRFGDALLMLELVHAPVANVQRARPIRDAAPPQSTGIDSGAAGAGPPRSDLIAYRLANASEEMRRIWDMAVDTLSALGDDVQVKELKLYHAFKRLKNFACIELYPTKSEMLVHLKLDPDTVILEPGFTRDMRGIGHFGTGDLQVTVRSGDDIAKALPLFQRAYEGS